MARYGKVRTRHYDWQARPHDHDDDGKVVELHLGFNAVAQIGALPDEDGFLIRVWPPNGNVEYGGSNTTCLSAVVEFGPDLKPRIRHIDAGDR